MSDTKQRIFAIVVFVLVILFGVGQFFSGNLNTTTTPATPTAATPTQVIPYSPTSLDASAPVMKGSCFASSVAAPYRADAWRCSVGNAISDPCFAIPGSSSTLVCGADPASTDTSSTFVLQLTKALPKPDVPSPSSTPTNWAWVLELSNGSICTPFTGTRPFSAGGDVATYSCDNGPLLAGATGAMIFGDLDDTSTTWYAEVGALSTATSTFPPALVASATIPVFAAWQ